ncbi:hypothetical protein PRK78_006150 [Emydomyces testavorans]|uniref:Uncharacterized protein n=1 Tax=Emydomyces testavorans TaxID=2070801 RepID=A0AAF0DLG3_9EURO|nr:hypothetical protein PRK78_006150 [Emydomyces testavorans]
MPIMLSIPRRISSISASSNDSSIHRSKRQNGSSRLDSDSDNPTESQSEAPPVRNTKRSPEAPLQSLAGEPEHHREGNGADINTVEPIKGGFLSENELHQRASSPLLGQTYKRNHAGLSSFHAIPKPLRPSESSSTLRSIYDPAGSLLTTSHKSSNASHNDLALGNNFPLVTQSASDLENGCDMSVAHKNRRKSLKSRHRPLMIDLSKLFPRPRDSILPLLSPNRLTTSPSPVSITSDASATKTTKSDRTHSGSKLMKVPRAKEAVEMGPKQRKEKLQREEQEQREYRERQRLYHEQQGRLQDEPVAGPTLSQRRKYDGWRDPTKYRHRAGPDWFDGPAGQVSDDDEDDGFGEQEGKDTVPAMLAALQEATRPKQSSIPKQSSVNSTSRSNYTNYKSVSRSSSRTMRLSSNNSAVRQAPSAQGLSPGSIYHPTSRLDGSLSEADAVSSRSGGVKADARDKAMGRPSKLSLDVTNLNEASVLCLSSSEDDDEEDNEDAASGFVNRTVLRDSIASFDEGAEICTARAIETRSRLSVRKIPVNSPTQNRAPHSPIAANRDKSAPSSIRSFNLSRSSSLRQTRRIPSISETPNSPSLPPSAARSLDRRRPGSQSQSNGQIPPNNRRSRFMAVTRQEEHLLELIRRNKGSIPGHVCADVELGRSEPDARSLPAHRPVSAYNADISFLKLSPGVPPRKMMQFHAESGTFSERNSLAVSDPGDAATEHSGMSPRTSFVQSDSFSSPSTGLASPLTPTLPAAHRLSPRRSHRSQFSASIAPEERRPSATQTDSSSAIIFDSEENNKKDAEPNEDLPIWALGWNNNDPGVAVVH